MLPMIELGGNINIHSLFANWLRDMQRNGVETAEGRVYNHIDELLRDSCDELNSGRYLKAAAIWARITRLLSKQQTANKPQLEQQLVVVFKYMDSVDKMKPKDLTTVTLSMAKIVKNIREASHMKRINVYHQTLGRLLQKSNPFGHFHFAMAANKKMISFDARDLSNLLCLCTGWP